MSALLCSAVVFLLSVTRPVEFTPQTALSTLENDHAQVQWAKAARYLVEPVKYVPADKWMQPYRMKGEDLREANGAQVTSLMIERALALESQSAQIDFKTDTYLYGDSFRIGHYLAHWDLKSSVKLNQVLCASALKKLDQVMFAVEAPWIGALISDRVRAADISAPNDIKQFSSHFQLLVGEAPFLFIALWDNPANKRLQETGDEVFKSMMKDGDEPHSGTGRAFDLDGVVSTHLLLVPAFRRYVVQVMLSKQPRALAIRTRLGVAFQSDDASISVVDAHRPHISVSVADIVAYKIHKVLKDAPNFDPFWPEAKRAIVRTKIYKWLLNDSLDWEKIAKNPWHFWFDEGWEDTVPPT
jgi:hypothetical protein